MKLAVLGLLVVGSAASAHDLVFDGNTGALGIEIVSIARTNGAFATPSVNNPLINGKNLYAPDLVRNGTRWNLYYGGWRDSSDVNDRIYFAVSDDLVPDGTWSGQSVIIDNGDYEHVNDPSVQRRSPSDWVMAYTVAKDGKDWIAISTSRDGASWTPNRGTPTALVTITGRSFYSIARSSLVWTGTRWRLYFDAKATAAGGLHSFVAESTEQGTPTRFRYLGAFGDQNSFPGFFEPDVEYAGGVYTAVVQRHFRELVLLTSVDGKTFSPRGTALVSGTPAFLREKVSNPGLLYDSTTRQYLGYAFGMTDSPQVVDHDIGFAYTQFRPSVLSCPSTWHGFSEATAPDRARVLTFGAQTACRIRIENGAGKLVHEATVNARAGDRFRFVQSGPLGLELDDDEGDPLVFEDAGEAEDGDVLGGCSASTGATPLLGLLVPLLRRRRR